MGALDPAKILVILVIALIVLGPERLPKVARQLGAAWRELMRIKERFEEEVRAAIPDVDLPKIPPSPRVAVASFLSDLTRPSDRKGDGDPAAASGGVATVEGPAAMDTMPGDPVAGEKVVNGSVRDPVARPGSSGSTAARADPQLVLDDPSMN